MRLAWLLIHNKSWCIMNPPNVHSNTFFVVVVFPTNFLYISKFCDFYNLLPFCQQKHTNYIYCKQPISIILSLFFSISLLNIRIRFEINLNFSSAVFILVFHSFLQSFICSTIALLQNDSWSFSMSFSSCFQKFVFYFQILFFHFLLYVCLIPGLMQ